jgi:hypothetical protein
MLYNVIRRLLIVKRDLVKLNICSEIINSDFINFNSILERLNLTPEALNILVPRYFKDENAELCNNFDSEVKIEKKTTRAQRIREAFGHKIEFTNSFKLYKRENPMQLTQ